MQVLVRDNNVDQALKALKKSPLALDLYAWSTHKALSVARKGKQQFIPWRGLMAQFGADYKDTQNFRRKAEDALKKIQTVYPGLRLRSVVGGIVVLPSSRPAIASQPASRRAISDCRGIAGLLINLWIQRLINGATVHPQSVRNTVQRYTLPLDLDGATVHP